MLEDRAGRSAPGYRKPHWIGLKKDILELFVEAQYFAVEKVRALNLERARRKAEDARDEYYLNHSYRCAMRRRQREYARSSEFKAKRREMLDAEREERRKNMWKPEPLPQIACPTCGARFGHEHGVRAHVVATGCGQDR